MTTTIKTKPIWHVNRMAKQCADGEYIGNERLKTFANYDLALIFLMGVQAATQSKPIAVMEYCGNDIYSFGIEQSEVIMGDL